MTNEALAAIIQAGRDDLTAELWQQCERFIAQQASRWCYAWNGRGGVTFDDLCQVGFLAMLEALRTYNPEKGVKFISWLGVCLRAPFLAAVGYRTKRQQQDPIEAAASLEAPLEGTEDLTVGDMVADPLDCIAAADRRIFIEQLHAALDEALDRLPQEQARAVRWRFYDGLTFAQAAELDCTTPDTVRKREAAAMQQLRRKESALLRSFLDERTPFYSVHGVHGVERLVVKRERLAYSAK